MYKALVHSVPGSGTRFVCEFAQKCLGYTSVRIEKELVDSEACNVFVQTHAWQNIDHALVDERVRVLFPLRPPYLSYLTRRYRVGIPSDTVTRKQEIITLHWQELIRKSEYMNPIYIPVEAGLDNRKLLQSISTALDAPIDNQEYFEEFVDQWPKVGTAGQRPERDEFESTGKIDGVTPTFLDFAVGWYENVVTSLNDVR